MFTRLQLRLALCKLQVNSVHAGLANVCKLNCSTEDEKFGLESQAALDLWHLVCMCLLFHTCKRQLCIASSAPCHLPFQRFTEPLGEDVVCFDDTIM